MGEIKAPCIPPPPPTGSIKYLGTQLLVSTQPMRNWSMVTGLTLHYNSGIPTPAKNKKYVITFLVIIYKYVIKNNKAPR